MVVLQEQYFHFYQVLMVYFLLMMIIELLPCRVFEVSWTNITSRPISKTWHLILGVGGQCIYRKTGTTLDDANEDGSGGTFQLPDLGSKYITASSNSGQYLNDTTQDANNNEIRRAGVAVTLQSFIWR